MSDAIDPSGTSEFPLDDILALTDSTQVDGYRIVADEITGEWRWGNERQLVFEHGGSLWGFEYRDSSGESAWSWEEDEDETVECYPVEAVQIVTTEYRRMPAA